MRLVSIVGDSISTYAGYTPNGYAVYYDEQMQRLNCLNSVYDIWWAKVNQALGAYLCVNNSYSGSKVSGSGFPAASCDERLTNLQTSMYSPDIILIYIGFNDFACGVKVTQGGSNALNRNDLFIFSNAYAHMLAKIHQQHPTATIVCGTLMRTEIKGKAGWTFPEAYAGIPLEDYNNAIRNICKSQKCLLADVSSLNIKYETLDGTHPTSKGHITIAHAWINCLEMLGMLEPSIESSIQIYNANKNNAILRHMVIHSLQREKVLMAFTKDGRIADLNLGFPDVIPIFTSPKRIKTADQFLLRVVSVQDYFEALINLKKGLFVNPFSESDVRFFIPYAEISSMLQPL